MQINVTSQKPMGQGEEIEVIAAGVPKLPPRNTHRRCSGRPLDL